MLKGAYVLALALWLPLPSAARAAGYDALEVLHFSGICDASAAEALDYQLVAVADDEDNSIRVYSRGGGRPVFRVDLSRFLAVSGKFPEADIEAAARIGETIYWITSHGRNAEGRLQVGRRQFFATTGAVRQGRIDLKPIGTPYHNLLEDLARSPGLAVFELRKAALLPPKHPGGLNIEGLAATPEGHLLIGFRNPTPNGKALLVPLLNPADLPALKPARLGPPILLDLSGLGIRSITSTQGRYLIIAGASGGEGRSHLLEWWGGDDKPRELRGLKFPGLNPEALTVLLKPDSPAELFVTSDDGTRLVGGKPCKSLRPEQKNFRAVCLPNPAGEQPD